MPEDVAQFPGRADEARQKPVCVSRADGRIVEGIGDGGDEAEVGLDAHFIELCGVDAAGAFLRDDPYFSEWAEEAGPPGV